MRPKQNSCHLNGSSCFHVFSYFPGLLDKGRFIMLLRFFQFSSFSISAKADRRTASMS